MSSTYYKLQPASAVAPVATILLLHGLGSSTRDWSEQIPGPNAKMVVVKDSRLATPVERPETFNVLLLKFYTRGVKADLTVWKSTNLS